jgi:hypothetical protein
VLDEKVQLVMSQNSCTISSLTQLASFSLSRMLLVELAPSWSLYLAQCAHVA